MSSVVNLGWWVISGEDLVAALHRVHEGEDPDLIYTELYANTCSQEDDE